MKVPGLYLLYLVSQLPDCTGRRLRQPLLWLPPLPRVPHCQARSPLSASWWCCSSSLLSSSLFLSLIFLLLLFISSFFIPKTLNFHSLLDQDPFKIPQRWATARLISWPSTPSAFSRYVCPFLLYPALSSLPLTLDFLRQFAPPSSCCPAIPP